MTTQILVRLASVIVCAVVVPAMANATLALKLDDGLGNAVEVSDGGLNDVCAETNCVAFSGPLGSWNINVTTGVSKDASEPTLLDLSTFNHHRAGTNSTLMMRLSDNSFLSPASGIQLAVGGTLGAGGLLQVAAYGSASNALFDLSNQIGSTLTFSSGSYAGAFSGVTGGPAGWVDPYSLTILTTLTFGSAAGSASSDSALDPVPEPSTIALTGAILVGLAAFGKRRLSA